MNEDKKTEQEAEQGDVIEIAPVDSPSENFLVAEQLKKMPNIFARGLVYIVLLMILTALIYSLLARIDIVVENRAVAIPESHIINISSSLSGYISEIHVSEGQSVEKNAPLFVINSTHVADSRETISYLSRTDELIKAIPLQDESYSTKISSARDEMKSVDFDLSYSRKEIENLETEFENTKKLYEKKLTSISEYNNIKSRLERVRTDIEKFTAQRTILEKNIRNLELEKSATLQSMKNELEMNQKLLSLKGGSPDHGASDQHDGNVIRAVEDGTVLELNFRNQGEYVRESDLLCTIVPADAPLYMDITVANRDAGFIETGMAIKYKFDAFPYTDYGTLSGNVAAISASAVEDKVLGYVYQIKGSLDSTHFEAKGRRYPVRPGMTATAEIVTERKTIYSMLFSKLKR